MTVDRHVKTGDTDAFFGFGSPRLGMGALAFVLMVAAPLPGHGRKTTVYHEVKSGESVAKIADHYGVSQRDLRELNGLKEGSPLKVGLTLRIPHVLRVSGKKYKVVVGDSLAAIGAKFNQSPEKIAHANKLSMDAPLPVGRVLVIPDASQYAKTYATDGDGPEPVLFLRIRNGERERLQLYSRNGKINHQSLRKLSYLARDKRGDQRVKRLHVRLVHMLQQVAERFPGKPIEIISGYRPLSQSTGEESQHAFGRAMDFRMPGVSDKELFRFCKTLPHSGCGYYPNSGFVHMDARSKPAAWIDRSSN